MGVGILIPILANEGGNVPVNIQTNENKYKASDGKIIIGMAWEDGQVSNVIGRSNISIRKPYMPTCKFYLDSEDYIEVYNFYLSNDYLEGFRKIIGIGDRPDIDIILELPEGKEAFGVYGQVNNQLDKGSKRGGVSTSLNTLLPSYRRR